MILALQALPLLLLIGLLFSGRVAALPAVLAALGAAIPAAFVSLPSNIALPGFLGEQMLRGAYLALQPMGVVLAGLLFYAAVSGAAGTQDQAPATARRVFIATLLLGTFMESVTGFAVGAVFALATLRGMGIIGAPAGAMALLALFSLLVYLGFVIEETTPLLKLIDQAMSLNEIRQIITPDLLLNVVLMARNALVSFLVFSGLLLILLLKPPTPFWTGGAPLSGDWRYTWMALAMLVVYGILLLVPGLRALFDLRLLNPVDYLVIALLAFVWALLTRYAWRHRWLEQFLQLE